MTLYLMHKWMLWKEQFILVASDTVEMGRQHINATLIVFLLETLVNIMVAWLKLQSNYVSVPFRAKKFFSFQSVRTDSGLHKTNYPISTGGKAAMSWSRISGSFKPDVNNDTATAIWYLGAKNSLNEMTELFISRCKRERICTICSYTWWGL